MIRNVTRKVIIGQSTKCNTIYIAAWVATCEARRTRRRRFVCGSIYLVVTSPGWMWPTAHSTSGEGLQLTVVMLELLCWSWTVVVIVGRPPDEGNVVFTTSKTRYEPVREDSWQGPARRPSDSKDAFAPAYSMSTIYVRPTPLSSRQGCRPWPPVDRHRRMCEYWRYDPLDLIRRPGVVWRQKRQMLHRLKFGVRRRYRATDGLPPSDFGASWAWR